MNYGEFKTELRRIENSGVSCDEQGYQSAPVLLSYTGCSVKDLLETLTETCKEPDRRSDFVERDKGAIRWCNEQLETQNET